MIVQTWTSSPWFWIIACVAAIATIHFRGAIEIFLLRRNHLAPRLEPSSPDAESETGTQTEQRESAEQST